MNHQNSNPNLLISDCDKWYQSTLATTVRKIKRKQKTKTRVEVKQRITKNVAHLLTKAFGLYNSNNAKCIFTVCDILTQHE